MYICFKVSKLSIEQLQRIEENKRRAQELRMQREKQMSQLNDSNSVTRNDMDSASNVPSSLKSFIRDEDSRKFREDDDIMMDDNEALDFIFSTT